MRLRLLALAWGNDAALVAQGFIRTRIVIFSKLLNTLAVIIEGIRLSPIAYLAHFFRVKVSLSTYYIPNRLILSSKLSFAPTEELLWSIGIKSLFLSTI
jgi:hypothetical protein